MIGRLKGRVEAIAEDYIILDAGGVGYVVYLSAKSLAQIPAEGEATACWIDTHVREDHIHLYGFLTQDEQSAFRLLCTVQGVGAKMALALLGTFHPAEIAQAIAAKDAKMLTRASGVGPKLAERIVTELKDKAVKLISSGMILGAATGTAQANSTRSKGKTGNAASAAAMAEAQDQEAAISALVNLGYGRSEAFAALSLVRQKSPSPLPLEHMIKQSLQELATGR